MPIVKFKPERDDFFEIISVPNSLRNFNSEDFVSPSEINCNDRFYLVGKEENQLFDLCAAITNGKSIAQQLEQISPDYLNLFLTSRFRNCWLPTYLCAPQHLAAFYGNLIALKELEEKKADLKLPAILFYRGEKEDHDLLFLAAVNNHGNIIEYLLKNNKIPASQDNLNQLLEASARYGRVEVAENLLANGADVNYQTKTGDSLLHLACEFFLNSRVVFDRDLQKQYAEKITNLIKLFISYGAKITFESPTLKKSLLGGFFNYDKLLDRIVDPEVKTIINNLITANMPEGKKQNMSLISKLNIFSGNKAEPEQQENAYQLPIGPQL